MDKLYVQTLFDSIAGRYDLLNHLLSGGIDRYWRRRAVRHLRDIQPKRILDVATGTGDFALATLSLNPQKVVGIDIAERMLERGSAKISTQGLQSVINLQSGDAENLQFGEGEFDAAIVAFGARNFEHLEKGLLEMQRVLRRGGMIVVLEFSHPRLFPIKQLYFFYFRKLVPRIGRIVSRSRHAYTYLPDTVMNFPEGRNFIAVLEKLGFANPQEERLTFGIASVYTGIKQ